MRLETVSASIAVLWLGSVVVVCVVITVIKVGKNDRCATRHVAVRDVRPQHEREELRYDHSQQLYFFRVSLWHRMC